MTEKIAASRYNHFVPLENGNRLAFNALTCGLAEMDPESYQRYCDLIARGEINGDGQDDLVANLKKGGFIVGTGVCEIDGLRAGHYIRRFGSRGFGVTLIPTLNCNFRCDYCYQGSEIHRNHASGTDVMSEEVCANVVSLCEHMIPDNSVFGVTWYGGEPLLAKDVIASLSERFMATCERKHSEYTAGMVTNGYLLTADSVDFLLKHHVRSAQVTVDGPTDVHDQRRCLMSGGKTYERIMDNLSNISDDTDFSVSVRINVDRRNVEEMARLLEDFEMRGFHHRKNLSLYFSQVVHYASSCSDISSHCMITKEFSDFMVHAYTLALDKGFRVSAFPMVMLSSCGAVGTGAALIEPNGDVQACWNTAGRPDERIGVLTSDGIRNTEKAMKWLGWSPFTDECLSCEVLPLCMGGCPYKSLVVLPV